MLRYRVGVHESSTPLSLPEVRSRALTGEISNVAVPSYDRDALTSSIVHIGVGGFHRAHLAVYVHELCEAGHTDWSIAGAGIMPGDAAMAEALNNQDMLYSLVVRGATTTDVSIIGSLTDFVLASDDLEPLVAKIASPATQIVSLTITEGGYPIDDATGEFTPDASTAAAHSAFGAIAAGLERRRLDAGGPITVLSCDNILANGRAASLSTLGVAAKFHGSELVRWITDNVSFPNSMVDRITPTTSDADRAWIADEYNIADQWPVITEPFRQWVVEDRFAGKRLPLEDLDVIVTDDVEPYEFMKLRLLNAGHSCLAYLAALEGTDTVDAALATPHIKAFLQAFLDREACPTVSAVPGIDLDEYIASLIERFSNPNVGDQIARLCLDGSSKFPKFLFPTIEAQLAQDGPIALSALALAGWCHYLGGVDQNGSAISISDDPRQDEAIRHAAASTTEPVAFLDFDAVFPASLRDDARLRSAFVDALGAIRERGVKTAIHEVLEAS